MTETPTGEAVSQGVESPSPAVSLTYSAIHEQIAGDQAPAGRLDLVVIGLRLIAVYFLADGVLLLVTLPILWLMNAPFPGGPFSQFLYALTPSATKFAVAVAIWMVAKPIGRWALRDVPALVGGPRARYSAAQLQALLFSVLGLYLAAYACRHLATLTMLLASRAENSIVYDTRDEFRETGITMVVELAVAAVIFFGARGLSKLWHNARSTR